jgi:hypothetical protein
MANSSSHRATCSSGARSKASHPSLHVSKVRKAVSIESLYCNTQTCRNSVVGMQTHDCRMDMDIQSCSSSGHGSSGVRRHLENMVQNVSPSCDFFSTGVSEKKYDLYRRTPPTPGKGDIIDRSTSTLMALLIPPIKANRKPRRIKRSHVSATRDTQERNKSFQPAETHAIVLKPCSKVIPHGWLQLCALCASLAPYFLCCF